MEASTVSRTDVQLLDREFSSLIEGLRSLTNALTPESLYREVGSLSVGLNILKCAGVLEQAFGGLTTNLWDDPFEWTLPETLSTPELVLEYLAEVDRTKVRAFSSLVEDSTLNKVIALPSGESCSLFEFMITTLQRASVLYGEANATLKILSGVSGSGFII